MDLIIAILMWIGAIVSPTDVNEALIQQNEAEITRLSNDAGFLVIYDKYRQNPSIVITELSEGD